MKNITQLFQEAKMASSVYDAFLNSSKAHGIKIGFEAEVCFPLDENSVESECPDIRIDDVIYGYRSNESAIDTLAAWFSDHTESEDTDGFYEKLKEDFEEWGEETKESQKESQRDRVKYEEIEQYFDHHGVPSDEVSKKIEEAGVDEDELSPEEYAEFEKEALDELVQSVIDAEDTTYQKVRRSYFEDNYDYFDLSDYFTAKRIRTTHDLVSEYSDFLSLETVPDEDDVDFEVQAHPYAAKFKKAFGLKKVEISSSHGSGRRTVTKWIFEPDSSIEPPAGHFGCEIVSPPLEDKEFFSLFPKVLTFLKTEGAITEQECETGLHIGVSIPGYPNNFDPMKLLMFIGDDYILKKFERDVNIYCESYRKILKGWGFLALKDGEAGEKRVLEVFEKMKAGFADIAGKILHSSLSENNSKANSRYVSVNIKDKYIEFRSMGGDYLANNAKVQETVKRMVYAMWLACNPEEQKQEYLKKLYSFIKQNLPEADPSGVDLFASYAAGEIDKYDLMRSLKQKRE